MNIPFAKRNYHDVNDKLYRVGMAAIEYSDGYNIWYFLNLRHRINGNFGRFVKESYLFDRNIEINISKLVL